MYDDEHAIMFQLQEARLASLDIPDRSFAELISQSPESTDWETHTTSRSTALDDPIIFDDFWLGKDSSPQFGAEAGAGDDGDVTDLEDVVVIGDRPDEDDDGGWQPGDPIPNPDGGGDPPPGDGGGGGGGPPPEQPTDRPHDACEDRAADTLADKINDLIKLKPDSNRVEYGALIWRDANGQLHMTEVTPGNNGQWIPPASPQAGGFDTWSQVVGYVHSHPTEVNLNGQWVTTTPESHFERPSTGDWVSADSFISQGASANNFTVYVSHAGQVREYDSRTNTNQPRDVNTPRAGHGNESGDFTPGASCP